MHVWTRRGALRSGIALLAGAAGLEVVSRARGTAATPSIPTAARPEPVTTLVLEARGLRAVPANGRIGSPVGRGERLTLHADLVDASGASAGTLTGVSHCTAAPLSSDDSPVGAIEMHTLTLRDGSILGMGASPAVAEGAAAFAVVGGTGRYTGARGSYLAEQQTGAAGGHGCARYTLTLVTAEDHRGI
jgi:hypothetical protein